MSEILCKGHDFIAEGHAIDGTPLGYVVLELDNGRALAIDHDGVTDLGDYKLAESAPPENPVIYGFVSWAELLEMLDKFRAEQMN
jgi:hypothetical protein